MLINFLILFLNILILNFDFLILMVFILMIVGERVLGLSLLISLIRNIRNNKFQNLQSLKL